MESNEVLFTAKARAIFNQDQSSIESEGSLNLKLSPPQSLQGNHSSKGTNPEQLFAASYAACLLEALKVTAMREKIAFPDKASVEGAVSLGHPSSRYAISVKLTTHLPGMSGDAAQSLLTKAQEIWPYSQSNIESNSIELNLAS